MNIRMSSADNALEQRGYLDLIVKVYPNGPMSEHIHSLKEGQQLDCGDIDRPSVELGERDVRGRRVPQAIRRSVFTFW